MTRKPFGPGPAAYKLPTLVGYDGHDLSRKRLPEFTMYGSVKGINKIRSPGPAAYDVSGLDRRGKSRGNKFTLLGQVEQPIKSKGPGPASHHIRDLKIYQGLAFSLYDRKMFDFKNYSPGPATYLFSDKLTKPTIKEFSLLPRVSYPQKAPSPGPAAYGRTDLNVIKHAARKVKLGERNFYNPANKNPSPNSYDLSGHKPGKTPLSYSFGTRHSPFAPPFVVPCDNN